MVSSGDKSTLQYSNDDKFFKGEQIKHGRAGKWRGPEKWRSSQSNKIKYLDGLLGSRYVYVCGLVHVCVCVCVTGK